MHLSAQLYLLNVALSLMLDLLIGAPYFSKQVRCFSFNKQFKLFSEKKRPESIQWCVFLQYFLLYFQVMDIFYRAFFQSVGESTGHANVPWRNENGC